MVDQRIKLKFNFFHGPDCQPINLMDAARIVSDNYDPFHGIVSRGLLNKLKEEEVPASTWHNNAALLEGLLQNTPTSNNELKRLGNWAKDCEVLSFAHSTQIALSYMRKYFSKVTQNFEIDECCLWNIKEGHISSVWKVTYNENQTKKSFALNISRDRNAALELFETSQAMMKIQHDYPDIKMAKVQDISNEIMDYFGSLIEVVVVRNDWIENAFEIHSHINRLTKKEELLLVERFLQRPESPAHIASIRGRVFAKQEVVKIKKEIKQFLNLASKVLSKKVRIDINDGDVVWNGKNAIVIAIN